MPYVLYHPCTNVIELVFQFLITHCQIKPQLTPYSLFSTIKVPPPIVIKAPLCLHYFNF
jgi:hypothetical protein